MCGERELSECRLFIFLIFVWGFSCVGADAAWGGEVVFLNELFGRDVTGSNMLLSDDGSTVIVRSSSASSENGWYIWTEEGGVVGTSDLDGSRASHTLYGVSSDGKVMVGGGGGVNGRGAFLWSQEVGFVSLGHLPGYEGGRSQAQDVSDDGKTVVGWSEDEEFKREAFVWRAGEGMVGLGHLPDEFERSRHDKPDSRARYVSNDGRVVTGVSDSARYLEIYGEVERVLATEGFVWREETGMVGLGDLPGGDFFSEPAGISYDGRIIAGTSDSHTPLGFYQGNEAFIRMEGEEMLGLGMIEGGDNTRVVGMSSDGEVLLIREEHRDRAFFWDEVSGFRLAEDVFREHGLIGAFGDYNHIDSVYQMSADRRVILGIASDLRFLDSAAFMVRLDRAVNSVPEVGMGVGWLVVVVMGVGGGRVRSVGRG